MSALPIQLKFFRKLELYQELKTQNSKASNSRRLQVWDCEKLILAWTAKYHHHLGSSLKLDKLFYLSRPHRIAEYRKMLGPTLESVTAEEQENIVRKHLLDDERMSMVPVAQNLLQKGYATLDTPNHPINYQVTFTPEGLLMGQVIAESEHSLWGKIKYPLFIDLTWVVALAAIIITILEAISKLVDLFT